MTPEFLFTLANQLALPGWLLLLTGLLAQSSNSARARQVAQASLWLGYTHESLQPGGSSLEVLTRGGVPTAGVRYPGSRQSLRTLSLGLNLGF